MAQLAITISDTVMPRLLTAFGHQSNGTWVDATQDEVQTAIKNWTASQVINYETTLAGQAENAAVSAEAVNW